MIKIIVAKLWVALESLLDPDGKLSFGRFATFILIVSVVSWDTCYVFMSWKFNLAHPDFHIPMGEMLPNAVTLAGQVVFMTAFYVATKIQELKKDSTSA